MEVLSCSIHLSPISSNAVQVSSIPTAWALLAGSRDDFALSPPFLLDPPWAEKHATSDSWLRGHRKDVTRSWFSITSSAIYHMHILHIHILDSSFHLYSIYFSMIQSMISSISHPIQPSWAPSQQPMFRGHSRTRFHRTDPMTSCQQNNSNDDEGRQGSHGPGTPRHFHWKAGGSGRQVGWPGRAWCCIKLPYFANILHGCSKSLEWDVQYAFYCCSCHLFSFSSKLESFLQQSLSINGAGPLVNIITQATNRC